MKSIEKAIYVFFKFMKGLPSKRSVATLSKESWPLGLSLGTQVGDLEGISLEKGRKVQHSF